MRYLITMFVLALASLPIFAEWVPDIEAWNSPQPEQPAAVVIRNATIWTATESGILEQADLLIRNGRISAVGQDLSAPRNALEIDGTGKHITPGIIDAHSHAAIMGGVNEMTRISTADVRIRDVIDSESINIYRQLAGGVTAVNLLHGSANAIGGQMSVIKMRWGASPADLVFQAAPKASSSPWVKTPSRATGRPANRATRRLVTASSRSSARSSSKPRITDAPSTRCRADGPSGTWSRPGPITNWPPLPRSSTASAMSTRTPTGPMKCSP
jgi:hypothetical protein